VHSLIIERAPAIPYAAKRTAAIGSLRVRGCDCGCARRFCKEPSHQSQPIANGIGKTALGGDVGILVWGASSAMTGPEVYDLGAGDDDLNLPELKFDRFLGSPSE